MTFACRPYAGAPGSPHEIARKKKYRNEVARTNEQMNKKQINKRTNNQTT